MALWIRQFIVDIKPFEIFSSKLAIKSNKKSIFIFLKIVEITRGFGALKSGVWARILQKSTSPKLVLLPGYPPAEAQNSYIRADSKTKELSPKSPPCGNSNNLTLNSFWTFRNSCKCHTNSFDFRGNGLLLQQGRWRRGDSLSLLPLPPLRRWGEC